MLNFLGVVLISCAICQNNAAEFLMYADKKINAGIIEVNVENVILLNHENVCSIKCRNFFCFFNFFQIKIVAIDFLDFLNIKTFQQKRSVGLWSFFVGGSKLDRFFAKNQMTERKLLRFLNEAELTKLGHLAVILHVYVGGLNFMK